MHLKLFLYLLIFMSSLSGSEQKKIVLITSLYNETVFERQQEYIDCLNKNINDHNIDKIHIFYDNSKDKKNNNVIFETIKDLNLDKSIINKRPNFRQIFNFVNSHYPDHLIVIANADIYFDETLNLVNSIDFDTTFVALTRWNIINPKGLLDYQPFHVEGSPVLYSQDVWIFKTPIKNLDIFKIELGTAFCDGNIAYLAYKAGYKVMNPCLSIVTHHLQLSNIRRWDVPPKSERHHILTVPWCDLKNPIYPSDDNIFDP